MKNVLLAATCAVVFVMSACTENVASRQAAQRWSEERANEWYEATPWMVGADYIPANAVNQIEMWYKDTYSPALIDKELGLGFRQDKYYLCMEHSPAR